MNVEYGQTEIPEEFKEYGIAAFRTIEEAKTFQASMTETCSLLDVDVQVQKDEGIAVVTAKPKTEKQSQEAKLLESFCDFEERSSRFFSVPKNVLWQNYETIVRCALIQKPSLKKAVDYVQKCNKMFDMRLNAHFCRPVSAEKAFSPLSPITIQDFFFPDVNPNVSIKEYFFPKEEPAYRTEPEYWQKNWEKGFWLMILTVPRDDTFLDGDGIPIDRNDTLYDEKNNEIKADFGYHMAKWDNGFSLIYSLKAKSEIKNDDCYAYSPYGCSKLKHCMRKVKPLMEKEEREMLEMLSKGGFIATGIILFFIFLWLIEISSVAGLLFLIGMIFGTIAYSHRKLHRETSGLDVFRCCDVPEVQNVSSSSASFCQLQHKEDKDTIIRPVNPDFNIDIKI